MTRDDSAITGSGEPGGRAGGDNDDSSVNIAFEVTVGHLGRHIRQMGRQAWAYERGGLSMEEGAHGNGEDHPGSSQRERKQL